MYGRRVRPKTDTDGEIDENWAQATADRAAGRSGEGGTDYLILFKQFIHDDNDGDGPGFDDGVGGRGTGSVVQVQAPASRTS